MSFERLLMPIGEAMFTQRSVRKFRPDPIPAADLRLIVEAAVKAPNGGNHQIERFLVVTDRDKIRAFAKLYHEAWWAKRRDDHGWTGPQDIPPGEKNYRAAMGLADEIGTVPAIAFAFAVPPMLCLVLASVSLWFISRRKAMRQRVTATVNQL